MKKLSFVLISMIFLACGTGESTSQSSPAAQPSTPALSTAPTGVGPHQNIQLNSPLNAEMVAGGKAIYELKCAACHKLTDQRVVGPGWQGLSDRRKPEWIMNMTTNVEEMLEKDAEARKMLKECLVQMPNQNLSTEDAREVLEFIFANDGQAVGS